MRTTPTTNNNKKKSTATLSKTGIASRLAADVNAHPMTNRSSDLVPLSHEFDLMRKQMRTLLASASAYHAAMASVVQARETVVRGLTDMSSKYSLAAPLANMRTVGGLRADTTKEHLAIYQDSVVDYLAEWETTVSHRVDTEQKKVDELAKQLSHYQKKVSNLREKVNSKETKTGKDAPAALRDKLKRNEDKLEKAWQTHERAASKLADLLEEVVKYGWKDLYPLLRSVLNFENRYVAADYKLCEQEFPDVARQMEEAYTKSVVSRGKVPVVDASVPVEADIPVDVDDDFSATTGSYISEGGGSDLTPTSSRNRTDSGMSSPQAVART